MSEKIEKVSDVLDSDTLDEWHGYFFDQDDELLDDENFPPIIINEEKYKIEKQEGICPICLEELDKAIGCPETCIHLFCYECITHWAKTKKRCPIDRRKFAQIMKFAKRKGKIVYKHEKGIKFLCGKPDLRPQVPETVSKRPKLLFLLSKISELF